MAVEVVINARNLHVSDRLRDHIEKKVGKLDHYLPELDRAEIDLHVQESARDANDRQVAQLTLRTRGKILRAEESSADMLASVDKVLDRIVRQIEKYKGKRAAQHWQAVPGGARVGDILVADDEARLEDLDDERAAPEIIRHKQFELSPMNTEEAIEQMELLGHDSFFVFYNAESAAINVLYRRKDGNFGLIEPVVA